MNKIRIGLYILLAFILLAWNNTIVPERLEISEIEAVRVLGLDTNKEQKVDKSAGKSFNGKKQDSATENGIENPGDMGGIENINNNDNSQNIKDLQNGNEIKSTTNKFNKDDVMMTIIRESENSEGSSSEDGSIESNQEIVSVIASSFSKAVKALQNYKSKTFSGGHVKYILIGEDMAKNNFMDAFDFIVREVELRHTAEMFITREMTANAIISSEENSKEKMADVLQNLEKNINSFGISETREVLDVFDFVIDREKSGLIPSIMTADKTEYNDNWEIKSSIENEAQNNIEFSGYAIIKDAKLIDYLSLNESRGANFVNNTIDTTVITIEYGEGKDISLDLISSDTEIKFVFDEDELIKIKVHNKSRSNITELVTGTNALNMDVLDYLQKEQSKILESEIKSVIAKSQKLNADFLNFEGKLKLKHPYKYKKIKDKWDKIFSTVPIEVTVETRVRRLYDVLDLESEE